VSEQRQFLLGHEPIGGRPNVRREIRRISRDPLDPLLDKIDGDAPQILSTPATRYRDAYDLYYLSVSRYLKEMSVAARHSLGRTGGKYTKAQRKLAAEYKEIAPFLELDLVNCLLHSRILMDRVAGIAQSFLRGGNLPGFMSFNDHKKFFCALATPYGNHEKYADYIRTQTDWFDMPLRAARDKFVVHAAPKHMRFLGYRSNYELELGLIVPTDPQSAKPLASVQWIAVNVLRLSYDVEHFLNWFCAYGLDALDKTGQDSCNIK
jgi:hypothetical protein